MRAVRFPEIDDRPPPRRFTRTNSGNLYLNLSYAEMLEQFELLHENERLRQENERLHERLTTQPWGSSTASSWHNECQNLRRSEFQSRVGKPFEEPATPLSEVPPAVPSQESSPEMKMRNELLNTLWSQPIGLVHNHLLKSRVKTCGEWIFALREFRDWYGEAVELPGRVQRGRNCLCLQGNLGAGKTMLM